MTLAILCLVSNTSFLLANGGRASCKLETENHFRLLSGQRRLPTGIMSSEPASFGKLMIWAEARVSNTSKASVQFCFPLIVTELDPHEHCDHTLFAVDQAAEDFGDCEVEIIRFAPDMSLSDDFKLVRTDSLV